LEDWQDYANGLKKIKELQTGNLNQDFAAMVVNIPEAIDLRERLIKRMGKVIEAYEKYTKLLEEAIGK
jgi:hypothetical protein